MQIQKSDRALISELYNETNPYKICDIFDSKSNDYLKKSPVYGHFRKTAA